MKWQILDQSPVKDNKDLLEVLLKNRGIISEKDKKEFIDPSDPMEIELKDFGVGVEPIEKAIKRIRKAKKNGEHIIIYGDYDADGITGTATLWETLHDLGIFVLPHIPERFSEGYGLNIDSVKKLREEDPKLSLIITVDHGITAGEKIKEVEKMGIDMIITDHHQKGKNAPKPFALIYTDKISGSALAWLFSREIYNSFKFPMHTIKSRLELAAIGTIADQLPLTGPNRSIVKFGLLELNNTKRPGLLALLKETKISEIGPYEIGFIIAPRINSMGRLKHGLESLRLLCTKDKIKADQISLNIGRVNSDRQKIVDEVVKHALSVSDKKIPNVIVLYDEKYHEGVIGLAAAKLTEKFYRPSIVMSVKGDTAKASARSISGFNIIETIREFEEYYIEGGGHPMAAGFSIKTKNIKVFAEKINKKAEKLLTDEILERKVKIDCVLKFKEINNNLIKVIELFNPIGIGNPGPCFESPDVAVVSLSVVGRDKKHLKLKIKQDEQIFDSIFFGGGEMYSKLSPGQKMDIVFSVESNLWNGTRSIQLKIKDIAIKS